MIELHPPKQRSTSVLAIGFDGDKRGNLHVQFHDGSGTPTARGYYRDAQRALYHGLDASPRPGAFVHANLKDHFDWVPIIEGEELEADPTLGKVFFIPAETPNTLEALQATIDAQRVQPERKGLFD